MNRSILRAGSVLIVVLAVAVPTAAFGSVITITGFTSNPPMSGTYIQGKIDVLSITAGAFTYSTPTLKGAVSALDNSSSFGLSLSPTHPGTGLVNSEDSMIGLDAGSADLGLGTTSTNRLAAWFGGPITGDGNTGTAEIFVVDWGNSLDNFQVQLLTSDATAGITGAVVVKTVRVVVADQIKTSTVVRTKIGTTYYNQPLGGVGIDLDSEGLPAGTQILGIMLPWDDGTGAASGLDPCIIAAVPEPASLLLLVLGGLAVLRRRPA
jgi:hypothetical protein